jgi:hypothetical protein
VKLVENGSYHPPVAPASENGLMKSNEDPKSAEKQGVFKVGVIVCRQKWLFFAVRGH